MFGLSGVFAVFLPFDIFDDAPDAEVVDVSVIGNPPLSLQITEVKDQILLLATAEVLRDGVGEGLVAAGDHVEVVGGVIYIHRRQIRIIRHLRFCTGKNC